MEIAVNAHRQNRPEWTRDSQSRLVDRKRSIRGALSARDARRVNELVDDLRDMSGKPTPPSLRPEPQRGPIRAGRGYVERQYQPGNSAGGAGIASPLVEGASAPEPIIDREYHPLAAISSSDGIFTLLIRPLKQIRLSDANGAQVVIRLAAPEMSE